MTNMNNKSISQMNNFVAKNETLPAAIRRNHFLLPPEQEVEETEQEEQEE